MQRTPQVGRPRECDTSRGEIPGAAVAGGFYPPDAKEVYMPVVLPPWYGVRYPRVDDLESYAWTLRGTVERGPLQGLAACTFFDDGITVIELDSAFGILEEHWQLAHEIGHLVLHCGYISPWTKDRQEWQAKLFAACALIPEERVRAYQNACEDAFVGALSANYEDIPLEDCPLRRLAGHIASIRLRALKEVA